MNPEAPQGNIKYTTTDWNSFVGGWKLAKACSNPANRQTRKSHYENGGKFHSVLACPYLFPSPEWHNMARGKWLNAAWFQLSCLGVEGSTWNLFATFWPFCGLRDWFLYCLTQSSQRNGSTGWISGGSYEACRGTADLHMPGGRRLWAKEYSKPSKAPRRSRDETLREIKTFKSSHLMG